MQNTPDFMPEFKANLPRTSHVLSHQFNFTATTAHLNPIFHTIINPGETIKLGFDFNLRTQPLDSAAFAVLKTHTEYFFVPFSLLYQSFDQVYYGISDQWSSALASNLASRNLPVLDFNNIILQLYTHRSSSVPGLLSGNSESIGQSSIRLFDLLGYNPIGIACPDSEGTHYVNFNVFPYPILAYNCIYQYYYRLDARESFVPKTFNWDLYPTGSVVDSNDFFKEYCLMHYRPVDNDYFTDIKVSPIVDVLNLSSKSNFSLAKSWLTRSDVTGTPVLSSGSSGGVSSNIPGSPLYSNNRVPAANVQTNFGFTGDVFTFGGTTDYVSRNGFDINTANIRAMFANEKLWSITGRAKKNYDDQTLAHFGFSVPHDVKHEISCFGHDVSDISIGEVISTSATSGAPLGEIAGKGYGRQNSNKHTFTAPCHGVIMVLFSVVVDRNYEGGIAKHNMVVNANDLYQPEYDHLGMQPLFAYETNFFDYPSALSDGDPNELYGWQYRYEQWKRRYNRINGAFRNQSGSLKTWCPSFTPYLSNSSSTGQTKNGNLANTQSYQYFMNYPTDCNQIFLAQYPNAWSTSFETWQGWSAIYDFDPFVINGYIDSVLVSTMSDYSLPRLDA